MNRLSIIVAIFSILLVGSVVFWPFSSEQSTSSQINHPIYLQNRNYTLRTEMFDLYRTQQADIVMLGNSHTFLTDWNELLGRTGIANRGIMNDITAGYLQRLDYVCKLKPKICFIEGGVNDVYASYRPEDIVTNFAHIVDTLRVHNIIPVVTNTFRVSAQWPKSDEKNIEILKLNALLANYCRTNSVTLIDINSRVCPNGVLLDDHTVDGIHLNAKGYFVWRQEVMNVLTTYNL